MLSHRVWSTSELRSDEVRKLFNYSNLANEFLSSYRKKINKIKNKIGDIEKKKIDIKIVESRLSKESSRRRRFRYDGIVIDYDNDEVTIAANLYLKVLTSIGLYRLIIDWSLEYVFYDLILVKELSDKMFLCGDYLSEHWRFIVHINRLTDYKPNLDFEALTKLAQYWTTHKVHTYDGDEELFYQKFAESVDNVLYNINSPKQVDQSVEQWLSNRLNWGGTGSAFSDIGKTDKEYDKTKWNFAWNNTDAQLKHLFWRKRKQLVMIFIKREATKSRGVAGADMATYLKMKYISDNWLDSYFSQDTRSTLWMSAEQRVKFWEGMTDIRGWRMPLDQSSFDQNQTKRQVLIIMDVLIQRAKLWAGGEFRDDLLNTMDLLRYSLDGGKMIVRQNDLVQKFEIDNGVMSGWYWTAFFDTIINLATFDMSKNWVEENFGKINITSFCAQGDDDHIQTDNKEDCIALWMAYNNFGFDVNPSKFYISNNRDEFLRKSVTRGAVDGYPARTILSILWRNPVGDEDSVGRQRLDSIVMRWKLLSDRLGVAFLEDWALKDMKGSIKGINLDDLKRWLHTPRTLSGAGLKPWTDDYVQISDSNELKDGKYDTLAVRDMIHSSEITEYEGEFKSWVRSTLRDKKQRMFSQATARSVAPIIESKVLLTKRSYKMPRPNWVTGSPTIYSITKDIEYFKKNVINHLSYLDWLSGFSKNLQNEIINDIRLVGPLISRLSIEYTSTKVQELLPSVLLKLRNSKGGVRFFKEIQLYIENNYESLIDMTLRISE